MRREDCTNSEAITIHVTYRIYWNPEFPPTDSDRLIAFNMHFAENTAYTDGGGMITIAMPDVLRMFPSVPHMDTRRILCNVRIFLENRRFSQQTVGIVEVFYDRRVPLIEEQQDTDIDDLCDPNSYDKDCDLGKI